jgi:hypothetical protein
MALFIWDPSSALSPDISARESNWLGTKGWLLIAGTLHCFPSGAGTVYPPGAPEFTHGF